ncbi:hypothetical protein ABZ707_02495 [Streptomyces sp. NPDC006923]|uniref:hypothetical protein n=1 Tax=Streptomyces sp. NPDC006923 TaxID=3155355 RepID=UPI0033FC8012
MTYDAENERKNQEIPVTDRTSGTGRDGRPDGRLDGRADGTTDGPARERSAASREVREVPGSRETREAREQSGPAGTRDRAGAADSRTAAIRPVHPPESAETVKPLHSRQADETRAPAKPSHAPDTAPDGTTATAAGRAPGRAESRTDRPTGSRTDTESRTEGRTGGKSPGRGTDHTVGQLFPQDESDKLAQRLQEALNTFVDGPRRSVEEAAGVLEEAAERLTNALAERPRSLRASWDGNAKDDRTRSADGSDTEDLRLALQSYREVTERLLRI